MQYPTMEFQFLNSQSPQVTVACHALGIFANNAKPPYNILLNNTPFHNDVITPLVQESHFTGQKGTTVSANCFQQVGKIILIGLGLKEEIDAECIRKSASAIYNECIKLHSASVIVNFHTLLENKSYLQAFVEGMLLAAHLDERFKSKKSDQSLHLKKVFLVGAIEDEATIQLAKKITAGVYLARELVNAPANCLTPSTLAQTAITLAERHHLTLNILEKEDCERLNMGAYLSVAQGSDLPPKFIHLCYKPKKIDNQSKFKKIALIGKGVTFDCGGLNLKIGSSQIELMKYDMAGAAALLGAAEAIGAIKPNKEIHFIIAATENMINGSATKPGDVVTASNGKTIEIDNTDAEGRLTLADALVYAEQLKVDAIVDLATLTGAIVTALGRHIAGLFGNHPQLITDLMATSQQTGEQIWHMPLEESYCEDMSSIIADIRNTGSKEGGGSITAALFLQQFVKHTPWAHIDIAGTVWAKKGWGYHNAGATGFGVRLLVEWILNH